MKVVRVRDRRDPQRRPLEQHDVTHRREHEQQRLRAVLELAYPDRDAFVIEEEQR
jgi:hypothetical protein